MATAGTTDNTPRLSFKVDNLPKLSSRGTDFTTWKNAWTITFSYLSLNDLLDDTKPASSTSPRQFKAHALLMQAVESDLIGFVTGFETPSAAWKGLLNQYNRDTSLNNVHLLRQLTELRMPPDSSLRNHMNNFHQSWKRMSSRCNSSSKPVAAALRSTFASDEVKSYFFLSTLLDTYDNVVDNLINKDLISYSQIKAKMLDLANKHSNADTPDGATAYWTQTSRNKPNECTYCKARNLPCSGHIHANCNVLKKEQKKRGKETNTQKRNRRTFTAKEAIANSDSSSEDEETFATTTFSATSQHNDNIVSITSSYCSDFTPLTTERLAHTTLSSILSANAAEYVFEPADNVESIEDINANATHFEEPGSPNRWIFDTGCSAHMSSFRSDFTDIQPFSGWVRVAGGNRYHVKGRGSVALHTVLPRGDVTASTLENTLYVPDMPNTHFFSWSQARHKGFHF